MDSDQFYYNGCSLQYGGREVVPYRTQQDMGVNNVPAFLMKLWTLVEDPSTDELIAWDPSGLSFHVYDQARFAKEILPFCFKHNNMASFIRQLNMYGFRKVVHIDTGAIKQEIDDVEFQHSFFVRGQEGLLENIKRKTSGTSMAVKTETGVKLNQEQVSTVLSDVNLIKGKQDNLTVKMDKMKKENEALWREIASLRQKHMKQQQIVNKLIQFMVHLVGSKRGLSTTSMAKRKMPLMISDASQLNTAKRPRYSKQLSIEELDETPYVVKTPSSVSLEDLTSSGPIIHEVVDGGTPVSPRSPADIIIPGSISSTSPSPSLSSLSPNQAGAAPRRNGDITLPTDTPIASSSAMEPVKRQPELTLDSSFDTADFINLAPDSLTVNSLTGDLDNMQDELDNLKDLLSGNHYNLDTSTVYQLLGEFDKDQQNASTSAAGPTAGSSSTLASDPNSIIGNELVQFVAPENLLYQSIPDLSDYITDDGNQSGSEQHIVDPMSFINTDLHTPQP